MWAVGYYGDVQGSRSTPANVRQLQVEVQRLRQRVTQANAKEEKHRADLVRSQRSVRARDKETVGVRVIGLG